MTPIVLDTHILVWWVHGDRRLSRAQRRLLDRVDDAGPAFVSAISLWEIANLFEQGRIQLKLPLRDWLDRATAPPRVEVAPITPAVAADVAALPSRFHRDPADRIIVATARVYRARVLTNDRRIIESGLVDTVD